MRRKKVPKVLLYLLIVCILLGAYMFIEPYWLDVKQINIKNKDIPSSFDGKKIVFVSDIHHGPNFSRDRVKRMVEKVNDLEPDIILIGGDYTEKDGHYITPCFEELKNLEAPLGKYGVLGNHDYFRNAQPVKQGMRQAGITILDNTAQWIVHGKGRIRIGGVSDLYHGPQLLNPTIKDVREDDFVILLSHNPDFVERIRTYKVDVVLSGHTHGGQVTFLCLWAPYIPSSYGQKYKTGVVETEYTRVYISNGVGSTGIPIRFFARPQINVFKLIKQ